MAIFNSYVSHYQRVALEILTGPEHAWPSRGRASPGRPQNAGAKPGAVAMVQNGFSVFKENYGTINHQHGSLNVPIEHHPNIRYMVYNGYYKVMSNIPKMGQLPTPDQCQYYVYIYIYII